MHVVGCRSLIIYLFGLKDSGTHLELGSLVLLLLFMFVEGATRSPFDTLVQIVAQRIRHRLFLVSQGALFELHIHVVLCLPFVHHIAVWQITYSLGHRSILEWSIVGQAVSVSRVDLLPRDRLLILGERPTL